MRRWISPPIISGRGDLKLVELKVGESKAWHGSRASGELKNARCQGALRSRLSGPPSTVEWMVVASIFR